MKFLYSKLIIYTIILIFTSTFFSCDKATFITIGEITGPRNVCYGELGVIYSVADNSASDFILWKVPDQAQIISGQGTHEIMVNFGRYAGTVCVKHYNNGEEVSVESCLEVSFGVPNQWCGELDFKGGKRIGAVAFAIGNKGYIGTGGDPNPPVKICKDLWEFDPQLNTWTQKTDFGGLARAYAVGFSIGSKGYIGSGGNDLNTTWFKDFWEYDPALNIWTRKADCGGVSRKYAFAFSIGNKGYFGSGADSASQGELLVDFYEYNPVSDIWTSKAFTPPPRVRGVGFSIANKGYLGTGKKGNTFFNDFWEYQPELDLWLQKADFQGGIRSSGVGFSIGDKGYLGTGFDGSVFYDDFYEYNPETNNWTELIDTVDSKFHEGIAFSIGNKGYIGTGALQIGFQNSMWVFTK
jgi:N-acetylneuraminic acid mutarotase